MPSGGTDRVGKTGSPADFAVSQIPQSLLAEAVELAESVELAEERAEPAESGVSKPAFSFGVSPGCFAGP